MQTVAKDDDVSYDSEKGLFVHTCASMRSPGRDVNICDMRDAIIAYLFLKAYPDCDHIFWRARIKPSPRQRKSKTTRYGGTTKERR